MWSEVNDNLHSFAALLKLINKPRNRTCVDRRELPVIELVVIALAICINILLVFQFSEWSFRTISPWKHNLYLLLDQVNSKHPYSALDICFVLLLTLREGWGYWIGWIFGKIPNGLPPLPPLIFGKLYCNFLLQIWLHIYARRYDGWIVWNACTWCQEIGTFLIFLNTIVENDIPWTLKLISLMIKKPCLKFPISAI